MQAFLVRFKYVAVFAALVAAGVGVPIPEEVTQLTAGALSHEGMLDWRIAIPVAWLGIVAGDTLLFILAQRNAERLLGVNVVRRVLTPARREALQRYFAKHAFLTIMVARHASGFRFPTFVFAASHGVHLATFVLADALSALASVPLVVAAGYFFWQHLSQARREVRIAELSILAGIALVVGIIVLARRRRRTA
ncbi:MAG TPA: DedA family protein [Myxococcaceae bacterium]|nr:DedA family protein [Myxococcaceae bacterium]